ncbi:MAG: group III truncated hemoglobin [Flavobacteriales bacterium]|nr:group III truncated hemoglobin [Flavobacteriales bacterium]
MRDIENRDDLLHLMEAFYSRMMQDEQIGYIFTEVAQLDLSHHLPLLADFWNNALFHTGGYKNNVVQIHKDLNDKETLTPAHFERWQYLLKTTIDDHFQGEVAEKMKLRATQVGMTMQAKLGHYS